MNSVRTLAISMILEKQFILICFFNIISQTVAICPNILSGPVDSHC